MMIFNRPMLIIDVETTGTDPVKDRIVELGVICLYPNAKQVRWTGRFNPGMPIPKEASDIHGITDADVAGSPAFSVAAPSLSRTFSGKDIAGYSLWRLDLPIVDEELRRCGFKLDLSAARVIDSFGIFSKKEPRKLADAVRKFCGREHDGAHGAMADAEATKDVLFAQLMAYEDLREMSLEELAAFSDVATNKRADLAGKLHSDSEGFLCFAFGKHRGERVRDRVDYAEWMLSKDFPGSTCECLRAELEGGAS